MRLTITPRQLNRLAALSVLPLMVVAILVGTRAGGGERLPDELPREGALVVANLRAASLTVHRLDTPGVTTLALPGAPHELAVIDGRVYATLPRANRLLEIEPRAPAVLRSLDLDGAPHGLAPRAAELLVALDSSGEVARVDLRSFAAMERFPVGDTPHALVVAPGGEVFVALARENRVVETGSGWSAPTGALPESVAIAGRTLVTADAISGTLSLFDLPGGEARGRLAVGGQPVRVLALDERRVAVALVDTAEVVIVDTHGARVERRLRVATRPDGLCLSPSGRFLAVVTNDQDAVTVYRIADWRRLVALATGDGPGACAWVA